MSIRRTAVALAASLALSTSAFLSAQPPSPPTLTLSIVGTNDLHGYALPFAGRGGLALLGGYLRNLRAVRQPPDGGVLLLDAGDTFQGGIESNLSEGALVVDGFNALGYAGAAIGNHEFDFGPLDELDPADAPDPRGAIKAAAARARYPFLAANLIDAATGRRVDWPNVEASTLTTVAGLRVGIIGAMTVEAIRSTLAANVHGLAVAPLAPVVLEEAVALRRRGADLVVLTIHAGGGCGQIGDPTDVSSCDSTSELFRLIAALPAGTIDAVVAGHTHAGLAHIFNGVPIIESWWGARAFGRMDLTIDRQTKRVVGTQLFPPQDLCLSWNCSAEATAVDEAPPRFYEGRPVTPDHGVVTAMADTLSQVRRRQAEPLPVVVDTLVRRGVDVGAPLGNLFADAIRESMPDADVAINNNGFAGLRADLPAGPLTFGRLYDVFPFDNRLVRMTLTGAQLEQVFADEIKRRRPGALSISGVRVTATCEAGDVRLRLHRRSGEPIAATTALSVVTSDMLVNGAVFSSVAPAGGHAIPPTAPIARLVVERWLRQRGGHLSEAQFLDAAERRWAYPEPPCRSDAP